MFLCLLIRSISTPVDINIAELANIDFFLYHILAKYICSYLVTTLVSSEEARNPTGTQSRIDLHAIFLTDELTEKNQMNELFQNKK